MFILKNTFKTTSKFLNFSIKRNFDQYLIRPKRHFILTYKYKNGIEPKIEGNVKF